MTNIDGIAAKEQYSQNKKEIKKEMFSKETKGIHTRGISRRRKNGYKTYMKDKWSLGFTFIINQTPFIWDWAEGLRCILITPLRYERERLV